MAFTPGTGAVISFTVDGASTAQRQIEGIGNSMGELSTAARSSLKELAAFAGVGLGLGSLAEHIIGAQREFDKLNASLVTATGSSQSAAVVFKSLQSFASTTPYSVAEAAEAFVKLKNIGLDPSEKSLRSYGNTAAAMGKNLDQMIEAVADAATGEFERLKEFGITASQNGDKVALTFKGTTTSVSKSADEIQAYLQKIGNTDFAGAMELRAATLDGAISNLADSWAAFVLQMSQSGFGDLAKGGVELLANNLLALAGAVGTVAAAKLASTIDGWVTATRKQIVETAAARAATIAAAEADVAGTAAKATQLTATQAMIVVAREEAITKLSSANSNIASARASIAAAEAAGAQSFALRTVRLATAELQVAETQRAAMLAELAILGRQQASVSAQVTAALSAQAAAQAALTGATAAGGLATGIASRAMGLLGGPIGAVVTVLGLAATAWAWYKQKQDEATADAAQKVGKMTAQIVDDLEKQNQKLRERIELSKQAGMGPAAAQGGEAVERMAETLKRINELKEQGANISVGDSIELITLQGMYDDLKKVVGANKELKDTLDASGKSATDLREKLTGVSSSYVADLATLSRALDEGKIKQDEYNSAVKKLAIDTFNGSLAGKEFAKSLDLASAAIKHQADVQGVLNDRQKEHIAFQLRIGQINEQTAVKQTADADIKALKDKRAALEGDLSLAKRKADSEKEQAALVGQIDVTNREIAARREKEKEDLFELDQKSYRQAVNNSADVIEKQMTELAGLKQQTQSQLDYNAQIGMTPKQIAAVTAAWLEQDAARKDAEAITAEGLDLTGEMAERIRQQAAAIRARATAVVDGAAKQELFDKNLQDANALVDIMSALDQAAQSAAQGMAESFGRVGTAIGGLTTALSGYERTQAAIAAQLAAATKDAGGDTTKIQRANALAAERSAQAQIQSYGDMASAAKGFFDQNSKGYKVLQGVEKAYRAAEMVMALESMTKKILFKETEVAANTTLNATKLTGEAATSAASTSLAATEASAWGVTAVVKAIASLPFPFNLAAGAATLAAVVAIGAKMVGGISGGSVSVSEQRQAAQGAGTVLGDKSAKSESIARSIALTAANSSTQIDYLSGMLTSLRTIESNIGSFANLVVRNTDISDPKVNLNSNNGFASTVGTIGMTAGGAALGYMAGAGLSAFTALGAVGGPIGMIAGALIGAIASKIPVIGNLMTSIFGGKQSLQDSGFTMSKASLAAILASGANAQTYADIKTSGGWFGKDHVDPKFASLGAEANQQFTLILKSMSDGIHQAADLLGVAGSDFDLRLSSFVVDIGKVSLKGLSGEEQQKAIEAVFSKLGDQMASYAVGGLQQFQKVGEGYLETLARVSTDYAKIDASMQSIGRDFGAVGLQSIAAREALVGMMGGIDELQSAAAGFAQNFLTKAEQLAPVAKYVDAQLSAMNLSWVDTRDEFKQVVLGLDLTTAAGREQYSTLMQLADAFAATHEAAKDLTKSAQEIADERSDLQDQLDQLTMTKTQLLLKERNALDAANRPLFDMVQAAQKLADLSGSMAKFRDDAKSLSESLLTGGLTTFTPEQQYEELRSQYEKTKAAALAGDTKAQGEFSAKLTAFLTASQKLNSGDLQYQADFALAQQDSAAAAAWAAQQVDVAQAQLNAMNAQNESMDLANATLLRIAQNTAGGPAGSGDGLASLVQVVKELQTTNSELQTANAELRKEVAGMRADLQRTAGDAMAANAEGQQQSAETIVSGLGGVLTKAVTAVQKATFE